MKQIIAIICLMVTTLTAQAAKRIDQLTYSDVTARVFSIISETTGVPESELTEDMSFVRDLKMNHEAHEAVREALSAEVGFQIPIETAEKITTPGKARNFVFVRQ